MHDCVTASAAYTVTPADFVAVAPAESVTLTMKLNVPGVALCPAAVPPGDNVNPGGSVPELAVHV
jgi:hypothetical protein